MGNWEGDFGIIYKRNEIFYLFWPTRNVFQALVLQQLVESQVFSNLQWMILGWRICPWVKSVLNLTLFCFAGSFFLKKNKNLCIHVCSRASIIQILATSSDFLEVKSLPMPADIFWPYCPCKSECINTHPLVNRQKLHITCLHHSHTSLKAK